MNNNRNLMLSLIISLLIIISFVTGKVIFSIASFFICCISFCFIKKSEMILILVFLLPFATIFKTSPGVTSLYTIIELFAVILFLIKNKMVISKKMLLSFALFIVYILLIDFIHGIFSIDNYLRIFVGYFLLYYFVLEYSNSSQKEVFTKKIILYFALGLIITSITASFSKYIPNFGLYVRSIGYNSLITNRFSGLNGDPNYYTINVILALLSLLILYSKQLLKIVFWPMFAVLIYFGMLTFSKSFYITLILIFILLIIFLIKNKNKKGLLITVLAMTILIYMLINNKIGNFNLFLTRLSDVNDVNSMTTGRFELWQKYINYLMKNFDVLFFGVGIGGNFLSIGGVHNWYLEMVYYFGIIGSVMYVCAFIYILTLKKHKTNKNNILYYSPFGLLLIMYFFLQMIFNNEIIFHFYIAFVIYYFLKLKEKEYDKKNI